MTKKLRNVREVKGVGQALYIHSSPEHTDPQSNLINDKSEAKGFALLHYKKTWYYTKLIKDGDYVWAKLVPHEEIKDEDGIVLRPASPWNKGYVCWKYKNEVVCEEVPDPTPPLDAPDGKL